MTSWRRWTLLVALVGGAALANAAGCSTIVQGQQGTAGGSNGGETAASSSSSSRSSSSAGPSSSAGSGGSKSAGSGGSSSAGSGGASSSTGSGGSSSAGGGSSSGGPADAGATVSSLRFEQLSGASGAAIVFSGVVDLAPTGFAPSLEGFWCSIVASEGPCVVAECMPDLFFDAAGAGTVTISGGAIPAGATATISAPFGPYYYMASGTLFTPGQTLSVSATGGMVPAFGPEEVTVPPTVTLTAPAITAGTSTVSTSSDLTVTWTGGQSGATMTFEGGAANGVAPFFFTCDWDASIGQGTVPKAVLAPFSGFPDGYFAFGQRATTTFTAGAYPISESAGMYATAGATYQ